MDVEKETDTSITLTGYVCGIIMYSQPTIFSLKYISAWSAFQLQVLHSLKNFSAWSTWFQQRTYIHVGIWHMPHCPVFFYRLVLITTLFRRIPKLVRLMPWDRPSHSGLNLRIVLFRLAHPRAYWFLYSNLSDFHLAIPIKLWFLREILL